MNRRAVDEFGADILGRVQYDRQKKTVNMQPKITSEEVWIRYPEERVGVDLDCKFVVTVEAVTYRRRAALVSDMSGFLQLVSRFQRKLRAVAIVVRFDLSRLYVLMMIGLCKFPSSLDLTMTNYVC